MKAYQISKSKNKYWWTGTINVQEIPSDCGNYKWVKTENEAMELSKNANNVK